MNIRSFALTISLTFLGSSCTKADTDTGVGAAVSVVCAGLIESACRVQEKCNVISGTDLSTKEKIYMGCLKDNNPDGLGCNDSIGCYVDRNGDRRTMTPNLCAPEGWTYVECTQADFERSEK